MTARRVLAGRYVVLNDTFPRNRAAETDDPRSGFYKAMLESKTFEAYLAAPGSEKALAGTRKKDPTDSWDEMLYALRSGWVREA